MEKSDKNSPRNSEAFIVAGDSRSATWGGLYLMDDRLEGYQSTAAFKIATSITVLDADPCGIEKTHGSPR
jgi:hypothetical protein